MTDLARIDFRILGYAVFGFVAGWVLFIKGFKMLWAGRVVQNTPTSKIRSLAVGLVEISGTALQQYKLLAPFSKVRCVYYHSILQQWRRSHNSGKWVTIGEYVSNFPFFVQDDTAAVLVDPQGAQTELPLIMDQRDGDLRYREYVIPQRAKVYILGTAKLEKSWAEREEEEIARRVKELVADCEKKAQLDTNKDGWIDEQEWEAARAKIRQQVRTSIEEMKLEKDAQMDDIVPEHLRQITIGKSTDETTFIISVYDEKELVTMFRRRTAMIYGGAVLIVTSLFFILRILQG
jgi:hypothetical protein